MSDDDDDDNQSFETKKVFIEFKIMILMILCILLGSQQHYGFTGEFSVSNIFSSFSGGIQNIMFLLYIVVLLVLMFVEFSNLYNNK